MSAHRGLGMAGHSESPAPGCHLPLSLWEGEGLPGSSAHSPSSHLGFPKPSPPQQALHHCPPWTALPFP